MQDNVFEVNSYTVLSVFMSYLYNFKYTKLITYKYRSDILRSNVYSRNLYFFGFLARVYKLLKEIQNGKRKKFTHNCLGFYVFQVAFFRKAVLY